MINRKQNRADAEKLINKAKERLEICGGGHLKLVINSNHAEYRALEGKLKCYEYFNKGKGTIWFQYAFELDYQGIKPHNYRRELLNMGFKPYELLGLEDGLRNRSFNKSDRVNQLHLDEYHRGKNIGIEIRKILQ